ncbi:NUDIX domain-containing protein [Nocardiopsis kunsanensis]|uniref:NUDIX domain-containing protein n=1 Tax=Nocardiopsis kunsanensis TaxID=141693 RepID=UPI0027E5B6C3|nr:NUDIX domain-containing protein [Nocardiopsis kunsanensis]
MPERYRSIVDVHVIMYRAGRVLLLERRGTGYADGMLHLPSGHLEEGEPLHEGAAREAQEETGVSIRPDELTLGTVVHHRQDGAPARVGMFFVASRWRGRARVAEPHRCGACSGPTRTGCRRTPSPTPPPGSGAGSRDFPTCPTPGEPGPPVPGPGPPGGARGPQASPGPSTRSDEGFPQGVERACGDQVCGTGTAPLGQDRDEHRSAAVVVQLTDQVVWEPVPPQAQLAAGEDAVTAHGHHPAAWEENPVQGAGVRSVEALSTGSQSTVK